MSLLLNKLKRDKKEIEKLEKEFQKSIDLLEQML